MPKPRSRVQPPMCRSGPLRNRRAMTRPARTRHEAQGEDREEYRSDAERLALCTAACSGRRGIYFPAAALRVERIAGIQPALGADVRWLRRGPGLLADQPVIGT